MTQPTFSVWSVGLWFLVGALAVGWWQESRRLDDYRQNLRIVVGEHATVADALKAQTQAAPKGR